MIKGYLVPSTGVLTDWKLQTELRLTTVFCLLKIWIFIIIRVCIQRLFQKPVEQLRWSFSRKQSIGFRHWPTFVKKLYFWYLRQGPVCASPVGIYLFKVNNRKTSTRREIYSKLTIKTPERRHWCEHISHTLFYNFYC